jgi:hypothetical protein
MSAEATKFIKTNFAETGDPIKSLDDLERVFEERGKDAFPLLNNGNHLTIEGEIGKTGVVLKTDEGFVAASLPHPRTRPSAVDLEKGIVKFGGKVTDKHLETALEIPVGLDQATRYSATMIEALNNLGSFSEFSQFFNGAGAVGSEPEAWVIDPKTGDLALISGGELQMGLLEETLEAISDSQVFLRKRANHILQRAKNHPDCLIIDTSVLPTSNPKDIQVNTGHDLGPYVYAIQNFLYQNYFNFSDPIAVSLMDEVAQNFGYSSYQEMHYALGNMAYWVMAASHASVGLHHLRTGNIALWVPAEQAIAVSDIFNSNLATIAEFLMFSTPVIFGQTPMLVDENGQELWPNDYRAVLRYLMDTTNPGPFIGSVEEMYRRITFGIVNGLTHTMDRSSYLASVGDKIVPVAHGRVRNRIASNEPRNQTGRIEYTGCPASPSVVDEVARNCFLQVLMVAALEALSNGQMPQDYFKEMFPSISSWERQKYLTQAASLYGFNHPEVSALIDEGLSFLSYMEENYPALKQQIEIARKRIQNLRNQAVASLEEYLVDPTGPVAEVIKKEIKRGIDPLELVRRVHNYEIQLAKKLLQNPFYWL